MIKKILFILLVLLFTISTKGQNNSTFKHFINSLIQENIEKGLFKGNPTIIMNGYSLVDSIKMNEVFKLLNVSDIDKIDILTYDKASVMFDSNARNGVMIINCKKSGTKKIKKILKD